MKDAAFQSTDLGQEDQTVRKSGSQAHADVGGYPDKEAGLAASRLNGWSRSNGSDSCRRRTYRCS